MRRIVVGAALLLALVLPACAGPDVTLGAGASGDGTPAPAGAQPPAGAPFLKGPITGISKTKPVTTNCVSEADPDGDGTVSSDDPPVCNPNPATRGSIGVKGNRADQGGDTEIYASVDKTVPIVRRGAGGALEPIAFDDLRKGDVVSLWITGPVMESYPLQGTASFIVLED